MPELSTLSDADRRVLVLAATRAARQKIVPYLPLIKLQAATIGSVAPSYITSALSALLDAVDRWERDEREALHA